MPGNFFCSIFSRMAEHWPAAYVAGFVINWRNTKMSYAVVYRTKEFNAQIAPQIFGTVSLN